MVLAHLLGSLLLALAPLGPRLPVGGANGPSLWLVTDEAAQTTAVLGVEAGPVAQVFLVERSNAPKLFLGLSRTSDGQLAVLRGGALGNVTHLQTRDAWSGALLSDVPLQNWQLQRVERLPDGSYVVAQAKLGFANAYHVDADGTTLSWSSFNFGIQDLDVDAQGDLWVTRTASPYTFHLKPDFQDLGEFPLGGRRIACAPDGTLWILREGTLDLLHVTASGATLGSIDLPTLADPDALDVDANGALWVSGHGADRVEQYAADGTHLRTLLLPGPVGVRDLALR